MTKLTPAMDRRAWNDWRIDVQAALARDADLVDRIDLIPPGQGGGQKLAAAIAMANDLLADDDPRKISSRTVADLRMVIQECGHAQTLERLADALDAFLPPEPLPYTKRYRTGTQADGRA